MAKQIYGEINSIRDLIKISKQIRRDVSKAKTAAALTELHKRQSYLVTLTFSPNFRKKFARMIGPLRTAAKTQYTKTAKQINKKAKKLKLNIVYDTYWG